MSFLKTVYEPIYEDILAVEQLIRDVLGQEDYAKIQSVNDYVLGAPGKRLRPALLLFTFRALSPNPSQEQVDRAVSVAAAIELIHMASLIHDDVIDHAPVRHNQPTIHTQWSMEVAVVYGVYLYGISLRLLAASDKMPIIEMIGDIVRQLCQGEMKQIFFRGHLELTLSEYLLVLKEKTGVLFRAACESGVLLSQLGDDSTRRKMGAYGESLGVVFQIADDTMDIMGDRDTLGKEPWQDLSLGELGLPLIYLLEMQESEEARELIRSMINRHSDEDLEQLQQMIMDSNVMAKCIDLGMGYLAQAKDQLLEVTDSQFKDSLIQLVEVIRKRAFK